MECLPLLASVLGNQYGVTVEIGGSEAYTDGKTIHLPALPLDFEPELIIMIRGFTDHESAHIRETDFETLRKANLTPFQHNLFNILEDWRIEERLSARYPGSETLWNTKGRGYEPGLFHFEHHLADGAFVVCERHYSPQGIRGEDDGTPLSGTSKGIGWDSR